MREIAGYLAAPTQLPLVVAGPDAAALVARACGRPLLLTDVRDLSKPEVMADAALCCALEGRLLCGDGLERLEPAERTALVRALDEHPEQLVLLAPTRAGALALGDRTVLLVEVPMPNFAERQAAWSELTGADDTRDVSAKFRLSLTQIGQAAEVATITARSRNGDAPAPADLDRGARHASSSLLGELATQLTPRYRWADLVLPKPPARGARLDLGLPAPPRPRALRVGLRARRRPHPGPQGAVRRRVGHRQDDGRRGARRASSGSSSSASTSRRSCRKYIGETEKNLDRIFEAATGSNAILFFDEADALFGKRSEVSDAHDRYANIEVAYLLQKMEGYPGAVILATNFRQNIDDAFVRRLDFVIDFPFPEAEDRKLIWRLLLPEEAPLGRRRRPRVPRDPVQALRRRDPQLLSGGGVPGRRRGELDHDAPPDPGGRAGVRQAGPADASDRLRALPRVDRAWAVGGRELQLRL